MKTYAALLRGVNVGGNAKLPMANLKEKLTAAGLSDVMTYIQSGNVIFSAKESSKQKLAALIHDVTEHDFDIDCGVVVFEKGEWLDIIKRAPDWWGSIDGWKHNLWILIPPHRVDEAVEAIGVLKPDIESVQPGNGVIYQSMSFEKFGRTSTGKIASSPTYKKMTIRNYNTCVKLADLLHRQSAP